MGVQLLRDVTQHRLEQVAQVRVPGEELLLRLWLRLEAASAEQIRRLGETFDLALPVIAGQAGLPPVGWQRISQRRAERAPASGRPACESRPPPLAKPLATWGLTAASVDLELDSSSNIDSVRGDVLRCRE